MNFFRVAEGNEMMKQQACWLPGSFRIFRGDSCDDERNAERNSSKLKIIHFVEENHRPNLHSWNPGGSNQGDGTRSIDQSNLIAHLPKSLIRVQAI